MLDTGQKPPRMRKELRKAISLIVTQGYTQRRAAQVAGMNEHSLSRALARPPIAAEVERLKALEILDAKGLRRQAKAIAIQQGLELMTSAKSEAVRARMVEFFAGDPKPGTQINVQTNVSGGGGYAYPPPGAQIVDITPAETRSTDATSEGQSDESQENKGDGGHVVE